MESISTYTAFEGDKLVCKGDLPDVISPLSRQWEWLASQSSVMASDMKGYEDALRALYRKDQKSFNLHIGEGSPDVKAHALRLAKPVFEGSAK